ncbi:MAG TPA: hypothetical protein VH089_27520 [Streptosporangiaceae bacterium]|nr:hypothetical protein [Streptosporangiaceae bacterium]
MIRLFRAASVRGHTRVQSGALAAGLSAGLLATVAGCGTSPAGPPATSHVTRAAAVPAWQRALNQVGPDGTVSTAAALDAFALAIGPVPGGRAPSGPAQAIPSGTIAVQWVLGHWGQLTGSQQHAVLSDLGVATTTARDSAPAADPAIPCQTGDVGDTTAWRAQLAGLENDIAAHAGAGPFTPEVYFVINRKQLAGQNTKLYTYGCTGAQTTASGLSSGCTIHVNPLATSGAYSAAELHDFLIHELTHCYLFLKLGAAYYTMPAWYVEGVAMWTMAVLGSGSSVQSKWWLAYLNTPRQSLFARAYDALGFFAHLAETGTDVWPEIVPIGQAIIKGGNAAGWRAADPTEAFLDSWGSGFSEGRYPGQAWQTSGPNLPRYQGPIPAAAVKDGQSFQLTSVAAGAGIEQVDLDAQVIQVSAASGSGDGRLSLDGGADTTLAQAAGTAYTTGSVHSCPAGTADAGATLTPITSGLHYVSVTGGLSPGQVTVQGTSLATFCGHPNAAACIVGTWTSTLVQVSTGTSSERGGAGVVMRISADGSTFINFGSMTPIEISGTIGGQLSYGGQVTGRMLLPKGPAQGSYTWTPVPGSAIDYQSLTATVHTTRPVDYTFGPVPVSSLAEGTTGVDAHPLSGGTWTCRGNTLVIGPPAGGAVDGSWTFTKTN